MKRLTALALALVLLLGLCACGSGSNYAAATEGAYAYEPAEEMAMAADAAYSEEAAGGANGWTSSTASDGTEAKDNTDYMSGLKIIKTGNMNLETECLEDTDSFLRAKVTAYKGILAESVISGSTGSRWASYTIRIPSESFDTFFYDITGSCVVTYQMISSEDVTEQYTDLSTRLETDRKKYERLLALLDEAETLTDIYSIQSEISDVEYEIDSITGTLNSLDSRVAYSTIYVEVNERVHTVVIPTEEGFGAKLKAAFRNGTSNAVESLQESMLSIAENWFGFLKFIIFVVIAALIVRVLIRRSRKNKGDRPSRKERRAAKKAAKQQTTVEPKASEETEKTAAETTEEAPEK